MQETFKEVVRKQVVFTGRTPGGCRLILRSILNDGRDVFQFMQLFRNDDVDKFFRRYAVEINNICTADGFLADDVNWCELTKAALERVLMLIEVEMKNVHN